MVSNGACISTSTVVSATSVMTVNPVITPTISINCATGDTAFNGQVVNFTANAVNGGTAPAFQWYVDGGMIAGATNATFSQPFFGSKTVYCELTSSSPCATAHTVASNLWSINIKGLGVQQVKSSLSSLTLFPNPTTGSFTITAEASEEVLFEVLDMPGKVVYKGAAMPQQGLIKQQVTLGNDIAPGQYILKVQTQNGTEYVHFVKQ
jgi:hypothetical protein